MDPRPVSLIIPNWNGADLLRAYLPSVMAAKEDYPGRAEVIVVDDASSDGSVDLLQTEFPAVKLVAHEFNQGFGKACWSGALAARHSTLVFLNSDVEVDPAFIAPLMSCFDDPSIFAASPLIFNEEGRLSNNTIRIPYFRRGKIRFRSFPLELLLKDDRSLPNSWFTLFPSGAAFAVDRARFLELQGFDDLFIPFYYEDTDLGLRAWRRGWKCIVVPSSRVIHFHEGTILRSFNKFKVSALRKRNRLFFLWKNLTSPKWFWQHFLFHGLRLCYRPLLLDGMAHVATMLAIPGLFKAAAKRRREKNIGVCSEEQIFQIVGAACAENRRVLESIDS
jgi:GT2 family glycosyltransferase